MAIGAGCGSQAARATARSVAPSQAAIELAIDLVPLLESGRTHVARLSALQFDLRIGPQGFDYGIKAFTRPGHQLTQLRDRDPILACMEALIGVVQLLPLRLRLSESGELFLGIEPVPQGFSQRSVT